MTLLLRSAAHLRRASSALHHQAAIYASATFPSNVSAAVLGAVASSGASSSFAAADLTVSRLARGYSDSRDSTTTATGQTVAGEAQPSVSEEVQGECPKASAGAQEGGGDSPGPSPEVVEECIEALNDLRRPSSLYSKGDPIGNNILRAIMGWVSSTFSSALLGRLDRNWEEEEFKEGVTDAFYMVNHLLSSGDFEALKPMVAPGLLRKFQDTYNKLESKGLKFKLDVQELDDPPRVSQVFFEREELLKLVRPRLLSLLLDSELTVAPHGSKGDAPAGAEAKPEEPQGKPEDKEDTQEVEEILKGNFQLPKLEPGVARTDKLWLVVGVTLGSKETWTLSRLGDGKLEKTVEAGRDNYWWFARGPVEVSWTPNAANSGPEIPQGQDFDEMPWFLLSTKH